jgi:hypothetical protein
LTVGDGTGGSFLAGAGIAIGIGSTTVGRDMRVATGNGVGDINGILVGMQGITVGHDLTLTTDGGTAGSSAFDNTVDVRFARVGHDLTVTTGDGSDHVSFSRLEVQNLTGIRTGADDDAVVVGQSKFLGLATFDGGAGTDTFLDLGQNAFASPPILIDF